MKKLVLAILAVIWVGGCASSNVGGQRRTVFMPQVGVIMTVQNNCAPFVSVESIRGVEVAELPFGESATLPISSRAFGGYSREIWVMVKAYASNLVFLGSTMFREYVDTYQGTQDRLWQVDRLDSPPGAQCEPPRSP